MARRDFAAERRAREETSREEREFIMPDGETFHIMADATLETFDALLKLEEMAGEEGDAAFKINDLAKLAELASLMVDAHEKDAMYTSSMHATPGELQDVLEMAQEVFMEGVRTVADHPTIPPEPSTLSGGRESGEDTSAESSPSPQGSTSPRLVSVDG